MITVTIKSAKGKIVLKSEGHAMYADKGQDIVCAAVSALIFSAIAFFDNGRKEIDITTCRTTENKIELVFYTKDTRMLAAVEFLETGIGLLTDQYPDHVKLISSHDTDYDYGLLGRNSG